MEPLWKKVNNQRFDKRLTFSSPELLWEECMSYFSWCDENPWMKDDWVGKDAQKVQRLTARPYTWTGLCLFLNSPDNRFRLFKTSITYKESIEFQNVIANITHVIETQQVEGAMVGTFNVNLVARLNNIAERVESTNVNINTEMLSIDEIKQVGKALEEGY